MPDNRFYVKFSPKIGTADNCICNACHHIGCVIKLEVPETTYNNGGKLKTKYRPFWLCKNCRDKLVEALKWEDEADALQRYVYSSLRADGRGSPGTGLPDLELVEGEERGG